MLVVTGSRGSAGSISVDVSSVSVVSIVLKLTRLGTATSAPVTLGPSSIRVILHLA